MTQLELARQGQITDLVRQAAAAENIDPEILRLKIAAGTAVVCRNNNHTNGRPLAVGEGLRTKTNANIGTSQDDTSIDKELEKAKVAAAAGADALMDLSTGGPIDEIRAAIIAETDLCIGSVPLYQAACDAVLTQGKPIVDMSVEDIFAGVKNTLMTASTSSPSTVVLPVRRSSEWTKRGGSWRSSPAAVLSPSSG